MGFCARRRSGSRRAFMTHVIRTGIVLRSVLRRQDRRRRFDQPRWPDPAPVYSSLMDPCSQHRGRIAPHRLGKGVVHVAARQPDISEHMIVDGSQDRHVATMAQRLRHAFYERNGRGGGTAAAKSGE